MFVNLNCCTLLARCSWNFCCSTILCWSNNNLLRGGVYEGSIERKRPPRGGFLFTMFTHQEPCVRGPPSKDLYQVLRGGSSYTRFLMREHSQSETPPGGGVCFDQVCWSNNNTLLLLLHHSGASILGGATPQWSNNNSKSNAPTVRNSSCQQPFVTMLPRQQRRSKATSHVTHDSYKCMSHVTHI